MNLRSQPEKYCVMLRVLNKVDYVRLQGDPIALDRRGNESSLVCSAIGCRPMRWFATAIGRQLRVQT